MKEIRLLRADEIEVRVQSSGDNWCSLLLYKDARCDMKILDEVFGSDGWQRDHKEIKGNVYCGVSVWSEDRNQWITKWDCGSESAAEKEKGEASDSFKRACFNLGIGRELYTAPKNIFIPLTKTDFNQKGKIKTKFMVSLIEYSDEKEINKVVIIDENLKQRYPKVDIDINEPIKTEIASSNTLEELQAVWTKYKHLQGTEWFQREKNRRKSQIQTEPKHETV